MIDLRFSGMSFVFTGELTKFSRKEAEETVQNFGGKASGSVSKISLPALSRCWSLRRAGRTTNDATAIPVSEPMGLNAWARLRRLVDVSFVPRESMKGFAVVSRNARPKVRM